MQHGPTSAVAGTPAVDAWLQLAKGGQLLAELKRLELQTIGDQAHEHNLLVLVQALADMSPGRETDAEVDAVLHYLSGYSAQVRIAHEESPQMGVPLYPIRTAASGALQSRETERGMSRAAKLRAQGVSAEGWLNELARLPASQQRGFAMIAPPDSSGLPAVLTERLAAQPSQQEALLMVALSAASDDNETDPATRLALYRAAVLHGRGAGVSHLLRQAAWLLDRTGQAELFHLAVEQAAPVNAALAIALLTPQLTSDPSVSQRLLALLPDPRLGAAAALALAGHPDPAVVEALEQQSKADGVAAERARLVLAESGSEKGEVQP